MIRREEVRFVAAADLEVVRGGLRMLRERLARSRWREPVLFVRTGAAGRPRYHVIDEIDAQRLRYARGLGVGLALIPGTRTVVDGAAEPPSRAVVLTALGTVRGAWVPTAERPPATRRQRRPSSRWVVSGRGDGGVVGLGRLGNDLLDEHREYGGLESFERAPGGGDVEYGNLPTAPSRGTMRRKAGDPSVPLRRTPHLDTPATIPTTPDTEFVVSVYVDDQPFDDGESGSEVTVSVPADAPRIRMTVTLLVSGHFVIDGAGSKRFDILPDKVRSKPVVFPLHVANPPPASGPAMITAQFSYGGRNCGAVVRQWAWDPDRPVLRDGLRRARQRSRPLTVFPAAPRPDLSVFITGGGDGQHFTCMVQTTLVPGYALPNAQSWDLRQNATELINAKLAAMINPQTFPADRLEALRRAGYEFWKAAPGNFKELYWRIIDSGKPLRSVYIASAEPSLPWELMIPFRDTGKPYEQPPLGVAHAIGRWCRGDGDGGVDLTAGPPSLPVRDAFVVTPRYQSLKQLDGTAEVDLIRAHLHGRQLRTASRESFNTYFLRNHASLLHFVCHGAAGVDDDDVLYLDDDKPLPSGSLYTSTGFKALCRARQPIVFINACEAGQQVPALAGGAGFPVAFGEIGARAVIAPLWPVKSSLASKIAVEVYTTAIRPGSPPVAEILRSLRGQAYDQPGADSYAAYAFFGDPTARIEVIDRRR